MMLKGLAILTVVSLMLVTPLSVAARTSDQSGTQQQNSSSQPTSAAAVPDATGQLADAAGSSSEPQQHITVVNPTPAPLTWSLHEKIAWAADLVLVIVAYAGIIMGVSLLKKIDRQTAYAETAAEAAATAAHAALLNAQAVLHAERPWILILIEPSRSVESSFSIMATNRGRTPARILASADQIQIVVDEIRLPGVPEYKQKSQGRNDSLVPIILLPGESTSIKTFSREEVKGLCDSEERFKRIETWEEKIYLYGKITYKDLTAPSDAQEHETNWCCWYIHGRQSSGLVAAGPAAYNSHT